MTARGGEHLHPPATVREIARRLEEAGFETWCVGGAVRDALLGLAHLDWDLATAATPDQVRRLFRRTIPVGLDFGTVGVLDREGTMHEVTTFRRDVQTDGRHAVVEFGASLDEDLARRDFTINAIAYSPTRRVLHDPFGGRADLARGIVRAVGEPDERMREDRLRALRAIRFAARLGFTIEPGTWAAIVRSAPHLGRLSAERVKQEIEKTMEQVARPGRAFRLWRESGAFAALVPPLAGLANDVLAALDCVPPPRAAGDERAPGRARARADLRVLTRVAALLSDLEPRTAERVLRELRFSNADVARTGQVVARWHELAEPMAAGLAGPTSLSDATVRRWVARMGRTRVSAVLRLAAARWGARRAAGEPAPAAARVAALYRRALRIAFREPVEIGDLAVSGDDLIRAGIAPGPRLGRILHALLDEVLEEPSRNVPAPLVARALELDRAVSNPE